MKRSIKEEVDSINTKSNQDEKQAKKPKTEEEVDSINTKSNQDGTTEKQAKKQKTEEEVESIKEEYFRTKNWLLQMELYKPFPCPCGAGDVVERTALTSENYGRVYYACPTSKPKNKIKKYGCGFFEWKDEHEPDSPGSSTSSSHENAYCSNCQLVAMEKNLLAKEKNILKAALDMERHPENYTCQSVAIVHELLNDMEM